MDSAADQIVDLYRRHAAAWAVGRRETPFEREWLDRFLKLLPEGGSVLDLGCGSGDPIGRYFIDHGYDVTGVDSSPELLAMCLEHFPGSDWRLADMRTLALRRKFNGVLAWDSFFHLRPEDQRLMFPIFRRHAAPGAALMFTSGSSHGVAIGEFMGEPLYHASLDSEEYRSLLNANGFEVAAYVVGDPDCGGRTLWLAQSRHL